MGDSMEGPTQEKVAFKLANGPLLDAVKALECRSVPLPMERDFHFYSNFQEFKGPVANLQSRVVSLLNQVGSLKEIRSRSSVFPSDPEEAYDWLVGVQDDVLERVDASLDRFELERKVHHKRKSEAEAFDERKLTKRVSQSAATEDIKIDHVKVARNKDKSLTRCPIPFHIPSIPRPQDKFDEAVDNSNSAFRHRGAAGRIQQESQTNCLQDNQHAEQTASLTPSGDSPATLALDEQSTKPGREVSGEDVHPLEEELSKMAYVKGLLNAVDIRKYGSLDDTPFTFVKTVHALKEMACKLQKAGEIAVDLENHHYRSFQGFICLMQVSTRDEDFVIDTIDLRSQIGPCLGGIFSDPTIRKVMHGADRDILWLQRDFGIYVCNLFDTGQAARVLQMPGFGLAFLLEHFCGVHADKRYQLADWRIRPLPSEMLKYAREDTHYLLYVHDMLKKQLWAGRAGLAVDEEDPCLQVYRRSRDMCLQLYTKDIFIETSYEQLYGFQEKSFRPDQLAVLASLYAWRDQMARKEDESTGYVLPNHLLFQLASEMPDTVLKLKSFLKGSHSFAGRHARTIVEIIYQAKEKAKPEVTDSHSKQKEHEHKTDFQNVELSQDKLKEQKLSVSNKSAVDEETHTKCQIEGMAVENNLLSSEVQQEDLVTQSTASKTAVQRSLEEDTCEPEATPSDSADAAGHKVLTDAVSELREMEVTRGVIPPVVVSRKTSSSFFNMKPKKISAMPSGSSHLSVINGASENSKTSNPAVVCLGVSAGSSISNCDKETFEASAVENGSFDSLVERPESYEERKSVLSEKGGATESETTVVPIQTDTVVFSSIETTAISPNNSSGHEGKDSEIDVGTNLVSKSTIQASDECQKDIKAAQVMLCKRKPSKLGAFLGGRSRSHQDGARESSSVFEQVQARNKVQDIKSSLVLPFSHPGRMSPVVSQVNTQHPVTGFINAITTIVEEKWDKFPESHRQDNVGPTKEVIAENQANTASQLSDVLMLEVDAREAIPNTETEKNIGHSPRVEDLEKPADHQKCSHTTTVWISRDESFPLAELDDTASGQVLETSKTIGDSPKTSDLDKPKMHRKWWPHIATDPIIRSSSLPEPDEAASDQVLDASGKDDQVLDASGKDGSSELPLALSDMHKNFKRAKKNRNKSSPQVSGAFDNPGATGGKHARNKKREREKPLPTEHEVQLKRRINAIEKVDFINFNYSEARKDLGIEYLYGRVEPQQNTSNSGRGRGSKRDSRSHTIPLNKSVFNPLQRATEQPRPEGMQPGQRRQVFPQSGNRTAVFRK